MRLRIKLARAMVSAGNLVRWLAMMVMRPDDLAEFGLGIYGRPEAAAAWGAPQTLAVGLKKDEQSLLEASGVTSGKALILGVGGGREALPLARMGMQVTGVDFVPGMLERTREVLAAEGFHFTGLAQELSRVSLPADEYELVWLSSGMYSSVPTRKRRLRMLAQIRRSLKPGGAFVCQFVLTPDMATPSAEKIGKLLAWLTLGHTSYERGDRLAAHGEFLHTFSSETDVAAEFEEAGFRVLMVQRPETGDRWGALLREVEEI